ncbi:hypothetical protein HKX54_14985 [Sulfitobacter sp. M57]|uniref:hypothetical protein n=1 Tax=unclassified Sulfitobacter TaxID=196795 RepID=UPI0023E3049F|nr:MULTISPECIES: hypothetical protein [unclassified Sulfitobacter]MDF3415776.1 hypothetical protein [Sulfitobacter sp. KE5]MDF3423256.1 hypothetical protein [Sulfitobacter sp. KE43]MDF3434322.1 hypothetical protein [Sulfitobacter sp. KE42]MDF3459645.1 hypothetical protein [Sulfitobacter sp. S74]MDF3463860.1 hypothetical protein [Sulfitobacter sp. Ks18]
MQESPLGIILWMTLPGNGKRQNPANPQGGNFTSFLRFDDSVVALEEGSALDAAISPENASGSTQVLQSLFESSSGGWRFYDDSLAIV